MYFKTTGCEIDLENERLQKYNGYGKYPLFVNATGDIIYPVGGPKLTFGKIKYITRHLNLYEYA